MKKAKLCMIRMMCRNACLVLAFILVPAVSFGLDQIKDSEILELRSQDGIVLLNFWATWCKPCQEEIPLLNRIHEKFPAVRLIGICMDEPENKGAIPGFLKNHPVRYSVFRRAGSDFQSLARSIDPQWKEGIPATFVFQNGKRVFSKIGILDEKEIENVLFDLSKQP